MNLGPGRTAKAVAAGDSFTCAILDDGTIKCWGMAALLGYGTIPQRRREDSMRRRL